MNGDKRQLGLMNIEKLIFKNECSKIVVHRFASLFTLAHLPHELRGVRAHLPRAQVPGSAGVSGESEFQNTLLELEKRFGLGL